MRPTTLRIVSSSGERQEVPYNPNATVRSAILPMLNQLGLTASDKFKLRDDRGKEIGQDMALRYLVGDIIHIKGFIHLSVVLFHHLCL